MNKNLIISLALSTIISGPAKNVSAFDPFYFPRATVINLPQHKTRRDFVTKELKSKKIPFTLQNAVVDGRNLTKSELISNSTKFGRYFMTKGMIGCFLSHRNCWRECVESNQPLLVFEDDVILSKSGEFSQKVSMALAALDKETGQNWDVLLLGALGCVHPSKYRYGLNIIPSIVGGKWRKTKQITSFVSVDDSHHANDTSIIHIPLCPYGMHAYIISPRGAKKLLQKYSKASYHVDVVSWGYPGLNIFALHPLLAWQTNSDTTIGGLVDLYNKFLKFSFLPKIKADKYTGKFLQRSIYNHKIRVSADRKSLLLFFQIL